MSMAPIEFFWNENHVMVPMQRFAKLADKQFVVGEIYTMVVEEQRSANSHRHYFACVKEAWNNLPEDKVARYPTPEHLRKWALIRCHYYDEKTIVCSSADQADAIVALTEMLDQFAVIIVKGKIVKIFKAKSQSVENMKKEEFERSKQDVLALLADVISVPQKDLEKQARQAEGGSDATPATPAAG